MSDNKTYSCLLFDMDGTIADTSEGIYNGLRYMALKIGIPALPEDVMHTFLGPPLIGSLMRAYGMTEDEAVVAVKIYREYYSKTGVMECNPYPGFCEMVRALKDAGVKVFVATSKPTPFAEQIVEKFGIKDCFVAVIGSNIDNTRTKKAEVIQYILDTYGLDKEDCLMIGDKSNDIDGARACGIDSLGVTYGFGSVEEIEGANPTYTVASPEQILPYAGV